MSSSRLSTANERRSAGVTAARSRSPGRSAATVGRAARANGRISSAITGVVSRRKGRVRTSAGPSARAPGRSPSSAGPSSSPSVSAFAQRARASRLERRRQLAQRRAQVLVLVGQRGEDGVRVLHELGQLVVRPPSSLDHEREVVHRAADVRPPRRQLLGDRARVARERLEAADRVRQLAPVAAQPAGAVGQQQLQVGARVAVERGEDLVEVDVGQRLADRDPLPRLQLARPRALPGVSSATMSFRPVLGRSSTLASR